MLSRKSIGFMGAVWLGIVALLMPPHSQRGHRP